MVIYQTRRRCQPRPLDGNYPQFSSPTVSSSGSNQYSLRNAEDRTFGLAFTVGESCHWVAENSQTVQPIMESKKSVSLPVAVPAVRERKRSETLVKHKWKAERSGNFAGAGAFG